MSKIESSRSIVMKTIKLISVLLLVIALSWALFSMGDKPENEFPYLTSDVNYGEVVKHIKWTDNLIKSEANFCEFFNHPGLEKFRHVPNYDSNFVFFYRKPKDEQFYFGGVMIDKRSPQRCVSVDISYDKNKTIASYHEFKQGHSLTVYFTSTGKLSRISLSYLMGKREIKFDNDEKIISDTYKKNDDSQIQISLEYRKVIESEIQASIAAGYTDVQKQPPRMLQLKLPNELKEGEVKDRLIKVGEYHQAVVDGKADPLVNHKLFTEHKNKELRASIHVFFSGKKVSFVGVYTLENWRNLGYFMVFDEYARLTKYVEGEIDFNQNLTGYEVAKTAKLSLRELPFEPNRRPSGIEITFHPTGYPACYRTIVKHRLFGKQMEWDDKGNVISDIDQDIPKALPVAADPRSLSE